MSKKVILGGVFAAMATLSLLYNNMSRPMLATHMDIYLSPTGNDSKDGLSANNAIQTLKRANQIAAARLKSSAPTDINIIVAGGTYFGQAIAWTAVHKDYYVVISAANAKSKPVFDGRNNVNETLGSQPFFFRLNAKEGFFTNLTLQNIVIRNYLEAVSFNGNRDDYNAGFNGNNKILSCTFDRIGNQYYVGQVQPAYAALRFMNSRLNLVKGNTFSNIRNSKDPILLHAIYAASNSSNNTITENTFTNQTGDPVRIRDFSNANAITKNIFNKAGKYGYSEWFCEKKTESNCTSAVPECPSWDNSFTDNTLTGMATFLIYVSPNFNAKASACKKSAPSTVRLRTARNVLK